MTQRAVECCLGRLVTDEHFRQLAEHSLVDACGQVGLELTPTELELLGQLDVSCLVQLSRLVPPGLHRTGIGREW